MTTHLRKAAWQALEALKDRSSLVKWQAAREALYAALKQPAQDEQGDSICQEDDGCPTELAVLQRFWRGQSIPDEHYPAWFKPAQQEPDQRLVNLLCRIHRDGGHYIAEHGLDKAVADADIKVAELNAMSDTRPQAREPLSDSENNGGKTGWPPGLLQDDHSGLSRWLASKPDARQKVRESLEQPAQGCDYCNHPQYAGIKCKNCGRVTEQPAQDDPCPGCRKGGVCRTPKCGRLKLPVDHPFRSQQPAQDEPVGEVECIDWDEDGQPSAWLKLYDKVQLGDKLYTHPKQLAQDGVELCSTQSKETFDQPVALETVYETIIQWDEGGGKRSRRELARRIVALYTTPPQPESVIDKSAAVRIATALGWEPKRKPPQFPTMLRKMWSGTEVQEWINENWSNT